MGCRPRFPTMSVTNVSHLFKLLGDATRLRILRLLATTELSVMELAEVTQLAQSRVSNHLKLLREEGLAQERREGAWRHYRVERAELPEEAAALWPAMEQCWQSDDSLAADAARLREVLARRTSRDGRFFDALAGEWDDIRANLFGDSIGRALLRTFVPRDIVVADIGCGTGYALELLGGAPRRTIAIDNSDAMLSVAKRKVKSLGLANVQFRTGDAHDPPLKKGEADLATLVMVLHHLEDPAKAIAGAARALGEGGRLLVVDFVAHRESWLREKMKHVHLGFAREDIAAWMKGAGLATPEWTVLPGRQWTTPEKRKVRVPDAFCAIGKKEE